MSQAVAAGPDSAAVDKARHLAVAAKERAKAKRFDLAAEMFHEAFHINPKACAFRTLARHSLVL